MEREKGKSDALRQPDVQREIESLRGIDDAGLDALRKNSIQQRLRWFGENKHPTEGSDEYLLGEAYALLLERLRITADEAPIVYRTPTSITFHSCNFSRMNTPDLVGECGYVETDNDNVFLPDRIWQTALRQGSKLNCKWLTYVLNTKKVRDHIKNAATGTSNSMKNIAKDQILGIEICYPEPDEQTAIAEALSDTDSLIASLEKLITKKKAIKLGAMQELLTGKTRLPGFSGEWIHGKWRDVLDCFSSGATPYRGIQSYYQGAIKWVSSGELKYNVIFDTIEHISEKGKIDTSLTLHPPGTFLMAITGLEAEGTRGSCALLGTEATTNQSCMAIYGTSRMDVMFLYHYYGLYGNDLAFQYCQGTKQQSYTAKIVKNLPIYYPVDRIEQTAIASILSDMDAEIEQLEKKAAKYRLIKQGMMQELLTGRIRLIENENKPQTVSKGHNQQYDDAICISAIVNAFHTEKYPLGRVKVQKLLYFLRRKQQADVSAFKKKAAGPYNEKVRYKGGEAIAAKRGYIKIDRTKMGSKFSKGSNISEALKYLVDTQADIDWLLDKFQFYSTSKETNNLEVLATVDMAVCEIEKSGRTVTTDEVKKVIRSNKEWAPKLKKPFFTDAAIEQAIAESRELFA